MMTPMLATRPTLSFEEFEQLPDHVGKLELLHGELITLPPSPVRCHHIAKRLFLAMDSALGVLHAAGEASGLDEVWRLAGYLLEPDSWLRPDLSISYYRSRKATI
jgi:hypothetical protein